MRVEEDWNLMDKGRPTTAPFTEKSEEMWRLVIFDLDGTLLNTIDDLATSTNYALRVFGYGEHPLPEYKFMVGNGITKLIERALPEEARTGEMIMRMREEFLKHYRVHKADRTRPYPYIPELLERLRGAGLMLAVASNKFQDGTEGLVSRFFGLVFDVVLGQREGVPTKPDPTIVADILAATGVTREETLYVGDSGTDMRTAANAGVTSIGVTWGFRPKQELLDNGARFIVDSPSEIADFAGVR